MPGPDGDVQVTYALDHLAEHLSAAGRIDDLRCLITPAWLDKKRRHLGVDAYRSLARDVAVALRAVPASPADLPAFLRLCVLASTLNALVTDLPPESLRALAEAGQANQALAAVAMMIGRDRQARALHAIAQGRAQAAPSAAIDLWQQAESLVPGIEDPAQAGRLLAAIGRGLTGLAANDRVEAILARANTYLGHAVEEEAAHSWLLVSDGFADIAAASMDLGERQLATRYLDAAYVALRNADQELYPDTHRFTETFRTIVSLTARAGDTASLDRIGQTITDALERKTDARPPLFAQYGRARIALAAFAIGAADAGDLDRARWALIKALEAGSTEIYRPAVADSLAGLRHGVRLSAGADLMEVSTSRIRRATDPLAAQRLAVDEASMIAWAVAVLSPTDPPGPVAAAVAQVDSAMDRLAGEEERQRARTRWGPGRYDALLRQDRQYDPAVLRDEQLDNRVLRCIAQARCAGALWRAGAVEPAATRFTQAVKEATGLPGGRSTAVAALLSWAGQFDIGHGSMTQIVSYIADNVQLEWRQALDSALDGTLDPVDLVLEIAPRRAAAGDVAGLRRIAARLPTDGGYEPSAAALAYELARVGDQAAALDLVRSTRPSPSRRNLTRGMPQTLAFTADTLRQTGRAHAARRYLRKAWKAANRLAGVGFPVQTVVAGLFTLIRPAVLDHNEKLLARILARITAADRPDLTVRALDAAVDLLRASQPDGTDLRLPDGVRTLLSAAALDALARLDIGDQPSTAQLDQLFAVMGILQDIDAVDDVHRLVNRLKDAAGDHPDLAHLRASTALIRVGDLDEADAALAIVGSQADPQRRTWMIRELLLACVHTAQHLQPRHIHRLLQAVNEHPAPECVLELIHLGLALPTGDLAAETLDAAARHAHQLRQEAPELLAVLARRHADHDAPQAIDLITLGATSSAHVALPHAGTNSVHHPDVFQKDTGPIDRPPMSFYLEAAAPALRSIDPSGNLLTRIWNEVHVLQGFREDPAPPEAVHPSHLEIARYAAKMIAAAAMFYPIHFVVSWLSIGLISWLGNGHRGPWWLPAGIAAGVTVSRHFTSQLRRTEAPSKWVTPAVAPIMLCCLVFFAWCSATGLVFNWLPALFGRGSNLAFLIIVSVQILLGSIWTTLFARKIWTGGSVPYAGQPAALALPSVSVGE